MPNLNNKYTKDTKHVTEYTDDTMLFSTAGANMAQHLNLIEEEAGTKRSKIKTKNHLEWIEMRRNRERLRRGACRFAAWQEMQRKR